MERKKVYISQVHPNEGQIEGLPANPRLIKDGRFKKLVKSIQDLPEMTEARDLLVYPYEGGYIVIGGNMRLRAYQELGWKDRMKEDTSSSEVTCACVPIRSLDGRKFRAVSFRIICRWISCERWSSKITILLAKMIGICWPMNGMLMN